MVGLFAFFSSVVHEMGWEMPWCSKAFKKLLMFLFLGGNVRMCKRSLVMWLLTLVCFFKDGRVEVGNNTRFALAFFSSSFFLWKEQTNEATVRELADLLLQAGAPLSSIDFSVSVGVSNSKIENCSYCR